jgi:intermediate cleaving peptidase 55
MVPCKTFIPMIASVLIASFLRTGLSAAKDIFSADDTLSIDLFGSHLKSLLPRSSNVYVDLPPTSTIGSYRKRPTSILNFLSGSPTERDEIMNFISNSARRPLTPQLAKWRAIKSKAEQKVMRHAADISAHAHTKVN